MERRKVRLSAQLIPPEQDHHGFPAWEGPWEHSPGQWQVPYQDSLTKAALYQYIKIDSIEYSSLTKILKKQFSLKYTGHVSKAVYRKVSSRHKQPSRNSRLLKMHKQII